jgi:CDP-glucose 4,6-dehydratase
VKIPAAVTIDPDFWKRRRVLVTGHTGFKGSWLALWLQSLGAEVTGLSAGAPPSPSLYELAAVGAGMRELAADVRDPVAVAAALADARPEVVFHLAAQPVVRRSLRDPALTFAVNTLGTVNVLDAVRCAGDGVAAVVVVTSDKCYENPSEAARPFVEGDPLGGSDPYSASKACAELVTAAYRRSFFADGGTARVATARAGNVIGGGDWGADRLVPDAVRAVQADRPLLVRNPAAVRPWQHVLDPLEGYLLLAQSLALGAGFDRAWNFGPRAHDARSVAWIVERLYELWDGRLRWLPDEAANPPEAAHLSLDSSAAETELGWRPRAGLAAALELVVRWHEAHEAGRDMRAVSLGQIGAVAERGRP